MKENDKTKKQKKTKRNIVNQKKLISLEGKDIYL